MRDYRYLRSRGECGVVLAYLAQDPQRLVTIYSITRALHKRTAPIAIALTCLLDLGLIKDKWEAIEGSKPGHPQRFYAVTEEGLKAAA